MLVSGLKKLLTSNWHFAGVVFYFALHGYVSYLHLIPIGELLWLLVKLLPAGALLMGICYKLMGNLRKAGLFVSAVAIALLFFGVFQDLVTRTRVVASYGRLQVFLPVMLLLLAALFVFLKWTRKPLNKPVLLLNLLVAIYILIDVATLGMNALAHPSTDTSVTAASCDTCRKPPVYLVLTDSYFGTAGMKQFFGYDNSWFDRFLQQKGFRVLNNTHSNYLLTVYSMASMLNMKYLEAEKPPVVEDHFMYKKAIGAILNNTVQEVFKQHGYKIVNYSIFDLEGNPAGNEAGLLPGKLDLLNSQTLYYRLAKYAPLYLARIGWAPHLKWEIEAQAVVRNEAMMQKTLEDSRHNRDKPIFTYVHLLLPHSPFVYDSVGNKLPFEPGDKLPAQPVIDQRFLQYEVYANKKISAFIGQLMEATKGEAVIILMSDHGYRFAMSKEAPELGFQNLNAVYLPDQRYGGWRDSMTNVNQFRVLFNTLFNQQWPMLKDSVVRY